MRALWSAPAALILLAGVVVMGCADALGPENFAGTYDLQTVAGEPLPTVIHSSDETTVVLVAEQLRLEVDGTGSRESYSEVRHQDGGVTELRDGQSLYFRVVESGIEITIPCPPNALSLCARPQLIGRRTHDGLIVEALGADRSPYIYVRTENPS